MLNKNILEYLLTADRKTARPSPVLPALPVTLPCHYSPLLALIQHFCTNRKLFSLSFKVEDSANRQARVATVKAMVRTCNT